MARARKPSRPIVLSSRGRGTDPATGLSVRADTNYTLDEIFAELAGGSNGKVIHRPYRNSIIAHICIASIARSIAHVPLRLHGRGGDVIDDRTHAINQVLARPNGLQTWSAFMYRTIVHWYQDGIVHWIDLSDRDDARRAGKARAAAQVAKRSEMTPVKQGGTLVGWNYRPGGHGDPRFVLLDNAATYRFEDPENPNDGLPPHVPVCRSMRHHNLSMDFNVATMENGGEVGTIYQTEQQLTGDQVEDLRKEIMMRHLGAENHRNFAIAHSGLKIDRGTDALRDIDNLNGMRLDAEYIGATYGVTPIMRGDYSDATFSNARTQKVLFWEMTGLYLLEALQGGAEAFFLRGDRNRYELQFFLEAIPELKWRSMQYAKDALELTKFNVARNELNERFELGLEDQPWGAVPLVGAGLLPINVVVAEASSALAAERTPEGDPNPPALREGDTPVDPPEEMDAIAPAARAAEALGKANVTLTRELATAMRTRADENRRRRAIHDRWNASWAGFRRATEFKLRAYFRRQGNALKARLAEAVNQRADDDPAELTVEIIERIIFDLVEENGRLDTVMRPIIREALELGGKQIEREIAEESAFSFDQKDSNVTNHLESQVIRVRQINTTTAERIRKTLLDGMENGDSLAELSERIDQLLGPAAKHRGQMIAQTELHEAINAGRNEGMRQAGVEGKAWLTSGRPVRTRDNPDGVVRLAHKHAEVSSRAGIPIDNTFTLLDSETGELERAQYPGDPTLSAGNRINCRCVQIARLLPRGERAEPLPLPDPGAILTYEQMVRLRDRGEQNREDES
jgi:phage portal protein BeeE